jgi:hypothetical protein
MFSKLSNVCRWFILAVIVAFAALLMLNAAHTDSAIMDELGHIPAGYSYVKYLDSRLNPEHPPLVKALAGFPLLFQNLNFPLQSFSWTNETNGQWTLGTQFLYESGNDADKIIFWSRIGPIILTLILIVVVYLIAKELIGKWWALLPAFLTAFSPTILAHGHYVTTDIGAALGILAATAAFLNHLYSPSSKKLVLAGLTFGLAQLMKFSALLLVPYFLILVVIFYIVGAMRIGLTLAEGWRYLRATILIFLIGFILVFLAYLFLGWNYPLEKQVSDTESILSTFPVRFLADFNVWLAKIPILRSLGEYFLGALMVLERSGGGNTLYFLGKTTNIGSPLYFPLTFLFKEPPGSLILLLIAAAISFWNVLKSLPGAIIKKFRPLFDYLETHFTEFAMLLFIMIYWLSSITSNLNIGIRHIIPTLPFIYILASGAIKNWLSIKELERAQNFVIKIFVVYQELFSVSVKSAVLVILLGWYLISSSVIAPHFISYFNFFSGGAENGYRLVVDSNYDWGQDLKRLKIWADKNLPAGEKIAVDYFGGGNPKYYLGEIAELWWSARGSPANEGIKWLAVSINTIQVAKSPLGKVTPWFERKPEDEYRWLTEPYKPFARAGTSIFIYKLE